MSIFVELKRRNVIKVAMFYAIGAWLLLQVGDVLFGFLELPPWSGKLLVALLALGFVPALLFSWVYELTSEGIKKESEIGPEQSSTPTSGRRLNQITLVMVLVVTAMLVYDRISQQATQATSAADQTPNAINDDPQPLTDGPSVDLSIAVLPFINMSSDLENEYFSDGLAEELLNVLAKQPRLKVAARTSAFSFRGKDVDISAIGAALHVAHVVEGSVRKSGDQVRITAQLIKVDDGYHLWSETYDRQLTDIFALQDEIVAAILEALKVKLLGPSASPNAAVTSVEAFQSYLQGKAALAKRGAKNLRQARRYFETALEHDPAYVPAMTGLARTLSLIPNYARIGKDEAAEIIALAEKTAEHVLTLEPDNADAYSIIGTIKTYYRWDWDAAEKALTQALRLQPNDSEINNFAGDFFRAVQDWPKMIATEGRAIQLDPLHPVNQWDMAWGYLGKGDYELAIQHAQTANALSPASIDPYAILVFALGSLGRFEEMDAVRQQARQATEESEAEYLLMDSWAAIVEGRRETAFSLMQTIEPLAEKGEYSAAFFGFQYLLVDESEKAAYWLDRAYQNKDVQLVFQEPVDLDRVAADPLSREILQRPRLRELMKIRARNRANPGATQ